MWPNPNNSNVATVFLLRRTLGSFPAKSQKMFRRVGNSYSRSVPLARC
jgi:hypothetical protein